MNGLAFEHYVDQPWAIFHNWHSCLFQEKLTEAVVEANKAHRPLDPTARAQFRWYPTLLSNFIVKGMIERTDVEAILGGLTERFYALANHYEALAPILESKLLGDPESAERIVRWRRYLEKPFFRDEAEYLAHLGDDPNRAYRLTPPSERPEREKMNELARVKKLTSPAWAYLYVSCNSLAGLEPELAETLLGSEEYSYLAALVLRKRGLRTDVWFPLLAGIRSHRWAFHAMRDLEPGSNMDAATQQRLLKIVHSSPPWAVQLWESRGWRGEQLKWAHRQCVALSADHACAPELYAWYRMQQAMSGPKVSALAA